MPENPTEPINWAAYDSAVTSKLITNVARERGLSRDFVDKLHQAGFLGRVPNGRYKDWRAFPVHDSTGIVVAAHVIEPGVKNYAYYPRGSVVHPLVIGDLGTSTTVHPFESQWDMFAVMDRWKIDPRQVPTGMAFVSTRGSSNVAGLGVRLPAGATVIAWTQNDDEGRRWYQTLHALCLRSGVRIGRINPPEEYKDFNDAIRADPDGRGYRRAILKKLVADACERASEAVNVIADDRQMAVGVGGDIGLPPFPMHALPDVARAMAESCAEVLGVPPVLTAVCALGALSAAIGVAIAVQSGPEWKAYANLFFLASAASASGKTAAAGRIWGPIEERQNELIEEHNLQVAPSLIAKKKILTARAKKLERSAARIDLADEPGDREVELANVETELVEVERKLVKPMLTVGDATSEALGLLLADHGTVASLVSDARDEINNVLGRYRDRGQSDEALYLKTWSGDAHQVNRVGRSFRLVNARLSLVWLVQPDKLRALLVGEGVWDSGLLPRFLLVETGARMRRIDPNNMATIPPEVSEDWHGHIRRILKRYRLSDHEMDTVQPSAQARRIIFDFHNSGADRVNGGDLAGLEAFVGRWAEQAWRLALILHVAAHPRDASVRELSGATASAAVELVQWFCLEQHRLLAASREDKQRKKLERLLKTLGMTNGEATVRDLVIRHNWKKEELEALVEAFPTKICIERRSPAEQRGRPSHWVKSL